MSVQDKVWTEKFRPHSLDDVIGQEEVVGRMKTWVDDSSCPHLLLKGPAGVGKTSSAVAFAKEKYGDDWNSNLIEMNASDERGIDVVRDKIKRYARESPSGDYDFKIIFLDEVDYLTKDAQAALRRTMEQFMDQTRFFLSCNYLTKIIDPIQSRCTILPFNKLMDDEIRTLVVGVLEDQDIAYEESAVEQVVEFAEGDARRAISSVQASVEDGRMTEDLLDLVNMQVGRDVIEDIVHDAVRSNMESVHNSLVYDVIPNTIDYGRLLSDVMRVFQDSDEIPEDVRPFMITRVGATERALNEGNRSNIQLMALFNEIPVIMNSSIPNYD